MISQHKAANAMVSSNIRRLARQGHLDRCRPPWDERRELPFSDAEKRLVDLRQVRNRRLLGTKGSLEWHFVLATHICRVHIALDDIEDRDVACRLAGRRGDHAVLWLE